MNQLKTVINKSELTLLCVDAISELQMAVRSFPAWPEELSPAGFQQTRVIDFRLQTARQCNKYKHTCTAHSIFEEEYYEFLQAALKPGNQVAARIELVQAMAMLLRIYSHLNDYVPLSAAQEPRDKPVAVACPAGTPDVQTGHEVRPRLGCEKGSGVKEVQP